MQLRKCLSISTFLALATACQCGVVNAATFTYHGNLRDAGKPAEGNYDLELTLYSAPTGGSVIAGPVTVYKVPVHDSGFSVEADFGPMANSTSQAWLAVRVRNAGLGEFATLSARSPVSPDATTSVCPGAWTLSGNAGNPAGSYLGTADNVPLELRVNNSRAMRLEPKTDAQWGYVPNVVAGSSTNTTGSAIGATVGGGGSSKDGGGSDCPACGNAATGNFSVVSGGAPNTASGMYSSVLGGLGTQATGDASTVGGGQFNLAGGLLSTVGGGSANRAGARATVPGGESNCAGGNWSFAAGNGAKVRQPTGPVLCGGVATSGDADGDEGTFVWADAQLASFESTGPNQFLIKSAGGMGINTNAPLATLTVSGGDDARFGPNLHLLGNAADQFEGGRIRMTENAISYGGAFIHYDAVANALRLGVHSAADVLPASDVAAITIPRNTALVGVLRVPVTNALEVEGNASKTASGSWLMNSDVRIKRDIRSIGNAVDTLMRVRPVTFEYNADYRAAHPSVGDRRYYNVIAQEFAEVFPEAVQSSRETLPGAKATRDNEILQVDIHPALITTIAAVQEVAVAGQMRDERIAALSKENADLRARLERIERLLAVQLRSNDD